MFAVSNFVSMRSRIQIEQRRHFFTFLNFIFNRVSKSRIKEVGADRACAEWLMRNGAYIKWKGDLNYVQHYNNLPLDPKIKNSFHISHVRAIEASINKVGFAYFYGCKDIIEMEFHKCAFFDDKCIELLNHVRDSLTTLKITSCHEVTDKGLKEINNFSMLNSLVLGDLANIKELELFPKELQASLPKCKVEILQHPIKPPSDSQTA